VKSDIWQVRRIGAVAALVAVAACASPPFRRYFTAGRWPDAVQAFAADSSLLDDERALFEAGTLFSSPARETYDPERAKVLLHRLLNRFPKTKYRAEAVDRLALVDTVLVARDSAVARARIVEAQIAELTADRNRLRATLASALFRSDSLQERVTRLESDLRERDDQIRALKFELAQLKEIDLKPRPPAYQP
jgi:hypothetical protein